MSIFTKLGNDIASPVDASGAKRSVDNCDMQVWMTEVERVAAAKAMGAVTFGLLSEANASLGYAPWSTAWVINDPVPSNNGWYTKTGASGTGSWVRLGDLPYSYIRATNAGAGSANAIVATTTMPIPTANGGALISLNITHNSTAKPVTVAFNGAAALTIKTTTGADPEPGGLVAGMVVAGYKVGAEFRLLSEQASASIVAAAEAAAARAEAAAASVVSRVWFKTTTDLENDNAVMGYEGAGKQFEVEEGDIIDAGGFRAEVAADDEADPDLTTPALVNLFARPTQHGFINPEQYGLIGAGGNDHPKIQRALDSGYPVAIPKGDFRVAEPLEQYAAGQRIFCAGKEDTVVYSNSVVPHDVIRLRGTHADLDGGMWRGTMSAATTREEHTAVIRVLSGLAHVHDTRLLSNSNGKGNLITLDNWDPVTEAVIAGGGRYFHNIVRNRLGNYTTGYPYAGVAAFLWEIGLHATLVGFNHIIADRGVILGGAAGAGMTSGDRVAFNTIQSATGNITTKVGNGVDIPQHSVGEVVIFNYLELFANGVLMRRTDDTSGLSIADIGFNFFDNCVQNVATLGARRFAWRDMQSMIDYWNGWNWRYGNAAYADFFAPGGTTSIHRVNADGAHQFQILAAREEPTATLTGNDQVITPTSTEMKINGNGANRTGITIANGAYPGQVLTLTASTWGATIDNDGGVGGNQNIAFVGNAGSCVMGNSAGNVGSLTLKWRTGYFGANGAWVEQGRHTR